MLCDLKRILQCLACKSEEEHCEDHDKETKDDEEGKEKLPVHALHQKQEVCKPLVHMVVLGSGNRHFEQ